MIRDTRSCQQFVWLVGSALRAGGTPRALRVGEKINTEHRHRRDRRNRFSRIAIALVAIGLTVSAATAFAQSDPTTAQYENAVTQASNSAGADGSDSGLEKSVVGGLPFTGLDLIALVAVGVALASMGLALRSLTSSNGRNT